MNRHLYPILWFAAVLSPRALRGQVAGSLDSTFNPGQGANGTSGHGLCCVVQPDGRIVFGGEFTSVNGAPRNNLVRLAPAGSVESTATFNSGSGANNNVRCLAVQADGKILIGGEFTQVNNQLRGRIARLNRDGTVEGTATFNPSTGANADVRGIALQPDGKILFCGDFTTVNSLARPYVARLGANGALDSTGSLNPSANGFVRCVAVQPDGKVLIGGDFTLVGSLSRRGIARLNANGLVDATFDPGTGLASGNVRSLLIQPDGRVVIAGRFASVNGQARGNIARLDANGALQGIAAFNPGTGTNNDVRCLALQTDGKIIVGGDFTLVNGQGRSRIARLLPDGTLESTTTFNPGAGADEDIRSVAVQDDGRILATGDFLNFGGTGRNGIARLQNSAATSALELAAPSGGRWSSVRWMRGGSSPEINSAIFEVKPAGSAVWAALGNGARIQGGWELTGLALSPGGEIRARGHSANTVSESIMPILSCLEQWRLLHFASALNSGPGADIADPDFDRIPNLVEYALGFDPRGDSSKLLPQGQVAGSDFLLSFPQPAGVSEITYGAEWSTSLLHGSWTAVPDTGAAPQHTFRVPLSTGPKVFLRLRVTAP